MKLEINYIENPRLQDGSPGHQWCDLCGSRTGAFVELVFYINYYDLDTIQSYHQRFCKGCLHEFEKGINKTILKSCQK